ncbi:hypothetical protein HHK36_015899 [Tetracentron sinense]|uniref:Hydroxyproline-rich glycoprotein family protein n=1 Tax=Tetracentron sinense TaxID=13715 RepID=A0A834Z3Y4_TETSI|nr:hypothetical protein HHK36_015899 [Tetracentron sinense]
MKRQCDEKRNAYEYMSAAHREKGRSRSGKGENFSSQQVQTAHEEYDEEATLFVFRLKSLKQGQSRSLLTQAARHHAAQLSFFRKGLKSLEAVEPHVKQGQDVVSPSRNSMELDQVDLSFPQVSTMEAAQDFVPLDKSQGDLHAFSRESWVVSQSAPIFAEKRLDPTERKRQVQPSSTRKFHTYVLPTPVDAKSSNPAGSSNPVLHTSQTSLGGHTHKLWYSSPLELKKLEKDPGNDTFSGPSILKAQSVLKESNSNSASIRLPPPLADGFSYPQLDRHTSDIKKIKRQAFSGPLTSKPWSTKPPLSASGPIASTEHPQLISRMLSRVPVPQPSSSPKLSPSASPPLMSSPKISELHELPRPPISSATKPAKSSGSIGHSAPLVPRSQELSAANKMPSVASTAASRLPTPPFTVPRSFSIPSGSQKALALHAASPNLEKAEEVASPPLTPISFTNILPVSTASETVTRAGQVRGN